MLILVLRDKILKVRTSQRLVGTNIWLEHGEEVTEVEPEEDGFVTVKTATGEQGSLPASCLTSANSDCASDVGGKKVTIKSSQLLIGTKVKLGAGEVVTQVGEEEEDGYVTVVTEGGLQGAVPLSCIGESHHNGAREEGGDTINKARMSLSC